MPDRTERHIKRGLIERVQEEPVAFRVLYDGRTVVPIYALGRKVCETWWENGQKRGRWTWEYL